MADDCTLRTSERAAPRTSADKRNAMDARRTGGSSAAQLPGWYPRPRSPQ